MRRESPTSSLREWAHGDRTLAAAVEILIHYDLVDTSCSWIKRGRHEAMWVGYWVDFNDVESSAVRYEPSVRAAMRVAVKLAGPQVDPAFVPRLVAFDEEIDI